MPLLDRVATLIKANINDLVDKAENPEKLVKQLLLDMQNQFVQVKTQLAIAIADQHLLGKRQQENLQQQQEWIGKAELALQKNQEDLARVALERSLSYENAAKNFSQQIEDQSQQVQQLRDALHRLEQKMTDTKAKSELLIAQHRRARLAARAGTTTVNEADQDAAFDRLKMKVIEAEAVGQGQLAIGEPSIDQRFTAMERADQVDRLLRELKARSGGRISLNSPANGS